MIQTLVSFIEGGVLAESPEPVSVRTVRTPELPTWSCVKRTDFFDRAGAEAPLESEVFEQVVAFCLIDTEMRSSSSIARPNTPSTVSVKLFSSTLPSTKVEFVADFVEFSLGLWLRTSFWWDLEHRRR